MYFRIHGTGFTVAGEEQYRRNTIQCAQALADPRFQIPSFRSIFWWENNQMNELIDISPMVDRIIDIIKFSLLVVVKGDGEHHRSRVANGGNRDLFGVPLVSW